MSISRIVIGVLVLSLVFQTALIQMKREPTVTIVHAVWDFYPKTLEEARNEAEAIVIARVVEIVQAPDIVIPLGGDPRNLHREHREPNQRIVMEVQETLHGNLSRRFLLYHYGTDTIFFEDDPPYRPNEIYVLFLKTRPDKTDIYEVISPLGRYRVVNDRLELMPGVVGPLAEVMHDTSITDLKVMVSEGGSSDK